VIAPAPRRHFTFRDYLDLEEASNVKHEFFAGEIYAMAGGTPEHAALAVAVSAALFDQLAGGDCRVFSSDLRVRVPATGLATYPDVTVVCGALETDPESPSTITNPTVIVEVLSPSTEDYDRGEKLEHYRQIESLQECVLVAHDRRRIEVWRRAGEGSEWTQVGIEVGTVDLASIGCRLEVERLYRRAGL
jgi:Uma2 family endonuclease